MKKKGVYCIMAWEGGQDGLLILLARHGIKEGKDVMEIVGERLGQVAQGGGKGDPVAALAC